MPRDRDPDAWRTDFEHAISEQALVIEMNEADPAFDPGDLDAVLAPDKANTVSDCESARSANEVSPSSARTAARTTERDPSIRGVAATDTTMPSINAKPAKVGRDWLILSRNEMPTAPTSTVLAFNEARRDVSSSALDGRQHRELTDSSVITAAEFNVEPRSQGWIAENYIPASEVSLLAADGDVGKSTTALQLAAARIKGLLWLGFQTERGKTVIWSAEDRSDQIVHRGRRIAKHYGMTPSELAESVTILDRRSNNRSAVLLRGNADGTVVKSPLMKELEDVIGRQNADLLIIDGLATSFSVEQNKPEHARGCIDLLTQLCDQMGISIIVLSHPSRAERARGTGEHGSVEWRNRVRGMVHIEKVNRHPDLRKMSQAKSNNGPPQPPIY